MSYPGGYPPQGQPQPGQWPGQPAYGQPPAPTGQPYGAPQPYGQSAPGHPVAPQPYGQSAPGHPVAPQPYGQSAPGYPVPGQPYGAPQAGQPYGQQAPQYGQQAPQAPAPPGITVDASYEWFGFMLGLLTKPKITINGQQVPNTRWGENHIPVGPGNYQVWIATPWLFDMGANQLPVQVSGGPGTRVYYKPPAAFFLKGAIGTVPQKTPGMLFIWLPFAIAAVFIVLMLLLTVVAAA
ncbi:hypothetical protein [Nocardia sp. NPDC050710]|uniref:hypothetical protein n=1 Tax=Nocardia sp. NPDC050710 TaxID=3157220 RepID=UPI0033EA4974